MREAVEDVADGEHRQRVRDDRLHDIRGAEQQRDGVAHREHDAKAHEAERDGHQIVGVAQPSHRVGIAGAAIDADERLAAIADALNHDLHEEGHIGDDGIRSQRRLAAIVGQRDVVDDR